MKLSSYPKVYNLGHAAVLDIFKEPVVVQEKVDGSQFSFAKIDGQVHFRSRGAVIDPDNPGNLFKPAVEQVLAHESVLIDGWIYRGEAFHRPKHNVLAYDRVPKGNIMLFDIEAGSDQGFIPGPMLDAQADALGVECVPELYHGKLFSPTELLGYLDRPSVLGGQKVEGVVCKAYGRFLRDGKTMMGKYVSEAFKEVHRRTTKVTTNQDIIDQIGQALCTEARWNKAIQHLEERGELLGEPKDIGSLVKEVNLDVLEEEKEYICEQLFKWAWKRISRHLSRGLPEWYKRKLMERSFNEPDNSDKAAA